MIILDSDILIDLLRRDEATMTSLRKLAAEEEVLATTSVNVAEILRGASRDAPTLSTTLRILAGLNEVPLGPRAARRFGKLMHGLDKAGRPMPVVDGLVAAIALESGGRLMTRNGRHFQHVPGLVVLEP